MSTYSIRVLGRAALSLSAYLLFSTAASAALVVSPDDARNWQGATVGTFAQLLFGSNTAANRQQVIDQQILDDGIFGFAGATPATLIQTTGIGARGRSTDNTGTGDFGYVITGDSAETAGNGIDDLWLQTDNIVGHAIWDLGGLSTRAAIFNTIDHGPLPQEAIESTVYLSNDKINWTQAVTQKVWLEGFKSNLGIKWDGFTYAVGTATNSQFRYASIIWGGPGALQSDGDNEINGVMGLDINFNPVSNVPVPAGLPLILTAVAGLGVVGRRKRRT